MKYISTRGQSPAQSFCSILIEGLAPDGGLYMPQHYPTATLEMLHKWQNLSYASLAFEILSLYIDDIEPSVLKKICDKTYTSSIFDNPNIVSLKSFPHHPSLENIHLINLSHGPTLAFKDMAMQLLANLFDYQLNKTSQKISIIGATSGDTGSAAEYAFKGKSNIDVFMLSAEGKMSDFQRAQMFSLKEKNIHNICVPGVFDDCQEIVKNLSMDALFKQKYNLTTVNSINFSRMLAQVVYYFFSYFEYLKVYRATPSYAKSPNPFPLISFSVPTGNFGNICAGHIAKSMGLPIKNLILSTNENNVLDIFFKTGRYEPKNSAQTFQTSSPSMDISKASNFERFIFDFLGRDSGLLSSLFGSALTNNKFFDLSNNPDFSNITNKYGFVSHSSNHENRLSIMKKVYNLNGFIIDPHTADGLNAASNYINFDPLTPILVLETALAYKFLPTVQTALGFCPPLPNKYKDLESLEQKFIPLRTQKDVKEYIQKHSSSTY